MTWLFMTLAVLLLVIAAGRTFVAATPSRPLPRTFDQAGLKPAFFTVDYVTLLRKGRDATWCRPTSPGRRHCR